MSGQVDDARECATRLLACCGETLHHSRAAARHAEEIAAVVGPLDRDLLLAAAWLHDIGHAPQLRRTGFHPLDGALYLAEEGWPARLCAFVAHHAEARVLAVALGLGRQIDRFPHEEGTVADALVYADMTSGPSGERMSLFQRLDDIERRHVDDPLGLRRARTAIRPALIQAIQRTEHRLHGLRGRVTG